MLPKFWRANFLGVELFLSVLLSVGFAVWVEWLHGRGMVEAVLLGNRSAIYGTLASIFGSLLGFAITAVTIVLGFVPLEKMAIVRDSAHYQDLWKTFTSAIWALAFATLATLLGLLFDRDISPAFPFVYVSVLAAILSAFRLTRCIWILEKVIHLVTQPTKARQPH